jgi:uncharacterized protein (DUF2236 family)
VALLDDARSSAESQGITDRVLGKPDIDARYAELRAACDDTAGLFGPGSMHWRMAGALPVIPFMLTQAGLLEGLVPKIWWGTEGSVTRVGYVSRYARSYDAFADWYLGDLETALRRGRKIHGYHSRIGGQAPYETGGSALGQEFRATEQQLMLLTCGTQIVPLRVCYELLNGPLTGAERDQYWDESKRFCSLFGIDPSVVPDTWDEFDRYWTAALTSGELEMPRDGATDRYGPILDQSDLPFAARWTMRWFVSLVFNTMPEPARTMFEPMVPLAKRRRVMTATSRVLFRVAYRAMPLALTMAPRGRAAHQRVGQPLRGGRLAARIATRLPHPFGERMPSMCIPESAEADPTNSPALNRCPV